MKEVNVVDPQAIDAAMAETAEELGSVNILLCFAGVVGCAHAIDTTFEEWKRVLDTNTTGSWLCAQAAARHATFTLHLFTTLFIVIITDR